MALMASMTRVGVAVGGVDGEDIGLGLGHFDGAFEEIAGGADGGADARGGRGRLSRRGDIRVFSGCP